MRAEGVITKATEARRRRMLFVEDHPELLAIYERTFRHHEIILVDTGELALTAIRQQRHFDLVVCDLLLPDIDGVEVYRRARQMEPELAARFVFATAADTRQRFQSSLEAVDVPILEKPFGMRLIRELLERLCAR
jgi:CheY-like chemotaxis protein